MESNTAKSSNSSSLVLKKGGVYANVDEDGNVDECRLCGMDGILLCCDGCPSAYHSRCLGVSKLSIPEGAWYCPECTIKKSGLNIIRGGTSLRGAEVFGIDVYEQMFLGTCDHLLVMRVSRGSEPCLRYYNQNDIQNVLRALCSSVEYYAMYSGICKGILEYWELPEDNLPVSELAGISSKLPSKNEDGSCRILHTPLATASDSVPDISDADNAASGLTETNPEDGLVSCTENNRGEQRFDMAMFDKKGENDPSDLAQQSLGDKSAMAQYSSRVEANLPSRGKQGAYRVGRIGHRNSAEGCVYMGSSFQPQAFINLYTNGDFAASAATSLAVLSSEESHIPESHTLTNDRKLMTAKYSLQIKAFSTVAKRFFWPNPEKKLIEVPRDRCGWCLSCRATSVSKRGCLLNAAASNAIKGSLKILSSLRPAKNGEGRLAAIATYLMLLEESLCGLTVGPFLSSTHRKQWREKLEHSATFSLIKTSLLELEENIRMLAFSADWVKLDDISLESAIVQSASSAVGSTQRRGPGGRRGRKPSVIHEVAGDDVEDTSTSFVWWRGGMASKHIFLKGVIPQSLVKNAALKGGTGKIPGVQYAEGSDFPKRSRRFVWRAAVEMSRNASQLALQVRYLDLHVRWNELVRPEQSLQDVKGPDTEIFAFRNAFVIDKKIAENKIYYGVGFENQEHLPSRIMKSILEVEKTEEGKEKYWFLDARIPLYLIKDYEKKSEEVPFQHAGKCNDLLTNLQRRQLKDARKDIFSFLSLKKENLSECSCASCQLDVLLSGAVTCSTCGGYCHKQCTTNTAVKSSEKFKILVVCRKCSPKKSMQTGNIESTVSPLILRIQDLRSAPTVVKTGKQNVGKKPSVSACTAEQPASMKQTGNDSSVTTKNKRKQRTLEHVSEMKLTSSGSSLATSKSKKYTSGLVWKKKDTDDGIDFRLKHVLLKDNPNRSYLAPECLLCKEPYNSSLMYIQCETCKKWFHAEALELDESKIIGVVGFKCCRCRRIRAPMCPYTSPELRRVLEAKISQIRAPKQAVTQMELNAVSDFDQVKEHDPATPSVTEEELVNNQDDDSLFSLPIVEPVEENINSMGFEWSDDPFSVPGPQKLPVRRHARSENGTEDPSGSNACLYESSTPALGNMNPSEETSLPHLEWDGSMNGFEDDVMFDYQGLTYEDMEFEPQTYFSFTELLADDDSVQPDGVAPSGDNIGNWEHTSLDRDCTNPEQYQMGISYDNQEPLFSVEPTADIVPCRLCSLKEPCPDLCCQTCEMWVHHQCSPWDLNIDSSWEGVWKCGHCREWR